MKHSKTKNNTFECSLKIFSCELLNTIVFILIALLIFFISKLLLGYDTLKLYSTYIKIFILVLAYIGLFLGAHNSFRKINKNKLYLSKGTKFLVLLYQLILVLAYSYICYIRRFDVILFLGGYLSLYIQFFFNSIYTSINNKNYGIQKNKTKNKDIETDSINSDSIIDITKLK